MFKVLKPGMILYIYHAYLNSWNFNKIKKVIKINIQRKVSSEKNFLEKFNLSLAIFWYVNDVIMHVCERKKFITKR